MMPYEVGTHNCVQIFFRGKCWRFSVAQATLSLRIKKKKIHVSQGLSTVRKLQMSSLNTQMPLLSPSIHQLKVYRALHSFADDESMTTKEKNASTCLTGAAGWLTYLS